MAQLLAEADSYMSETTTLLQLKGNKWGVGKFALFKKVKTDHMIGVPFWEIILV